MVRGREEEAVAGGVPVELDERVGQGLGFQQMLRISAPFVEDELALMTIPESPSRWSRKSSPPRSGVRARKWT